MLSQSVEDYLKIIYKLQKDAGKVTTSAVAENANVSAASVTSMLGKLTDMKLVVHTPYREVKLTPSGEKIAVEVIRHHRLLELYLSEALGYTWDQVDAEAEELEHVISEEFEDKIDEALGHPTTDPHGDPIPTKEGLLEEVDHGSLSDSDAGQTVTISRINDQDPDILRYLASLGIFPGVIVAVTEKLPFNGPILIQIGSDRHTLGRELADKILVGAAS